MIACGMLTSGYLQNKAIVLVAEAFSLWRGLSFLRPKLVPIDHGLSLPDRLEAHSHTACLVTALSRPGGEL